MARDLMKMILKVGLLLTCCVRWTTSPSLPIFYQEIHRSPSCSFWDEIHKDKSFIYLLGSAASLETNVLRFQEYFMLNVSKGEDILSVDDDDDDEVSNRHQYHVDPEDSAVTQMVKNMKTLRRNLNEFFLPRLEEVIEVEKRMKSYNHQYPFLNDFAFFQVQMQDLDCLLAHWIKKLDQSEDALEVFDVSKPELDAQTIHTEEMHLLNAIVNELETFLTSEPLVGVLKSLRADKSRRFLARRVNEEKLRWLKFPID